MSRTHSPVCSFARLGLAGWLIAAGLAAQNGNRDEFARAPKQRPDVTIFSPLDLPTPTRLRTASGAPGPDYWQQRADYSIVATLDERTAALHANGTLRYVNRSPDTIRELWVHQHRNAFRPFPAEEFPPPRCDIQSAGS